MGIRNSVKNATHAKTFVSSCGDYLESHFQAVVAVTRGNSTNPAFLRPLSRSAEALLPAIPLHLSRAQLRTKGAFDGTSAWSRTASRARSASGMGSRPRGEHCDS